MELQKEYRFEAAHQLPFVSAGHKCRRLHGHSYRVTVKIEGEVESKHGWVLDYGDINKVVAPIIARLDHFYLNEVPGLENPTSEVLARWMWEEIYQELPLLSAIIIHETCTSSCVFRGK
jgi:6-pyruvoyltetrahydropterin/6-carboxytetrahydropterin synthase